MSFSTTFAASDKKPEAYGKYEQANKLDGKALELIKHTDYYGRNFCSEILQGSNFPERTRIVSNGFVDTVVNCYNQHHNLVIRPDDVWTAIMVQFSYYVNKEAEKFRGKFVNFEGKKELVVEMGGSLRTASYDLFVKLMSKKIDENLVDPEVKSWVLPSFSTTTDDDLVSCGVVFMAAMKKYFSYKCCLCCGIPNVTLEGTVQDWDNILIRLNKLKEYELGWWFEMLQPICIQFLDAKREKVDKEFWNRVCSRDGGGSGPTYLSGWITAFCVFDKEGNRQGTIGSKRMWTGSEINAGGPWPIIETDEVPSGSVEVDVLIDDNGTEHHSVMFAGHMGHEIVDEGRTTLAPKIGWVICLKPSPEEVEKLEKERENRYR